MYAMLSESLAHMAGIRSAIPYHHRRTSERPVQSSDGRATVSGVDNEEEPDKAAENLSTSLKSMLAEEGENTGGHSEALPTKSREFAGANTSTADLLRERQMVPGPVGVERAGKSLPGPKVEGDGQATSKFDLYRSWRDYNTQFNLRVRPQGCSITSGGFPRCLTQLL